MAEVVILANAGTALIWATLIQLSVGNVVVAAIETALLRWLFKIEFRWWTLVVLTVANFVSAWCGFALLRVAVPAMADVTIVNVGRWTLIAAAAAFVLTLLVEYPFFGYLVKEPAKRWRCAARLVIGVHLVSYLLLAGWFWLASATSMLTKVAVASPETLLPREAFYLIYFADDGRRIVRQRLDGSDRQVLMTISRANPADRVFARKSGDDRVDLYAVMQSEDGAKRRETLLSSQYATFAPIERRRAEGHTDRVYGSADTVGRVPAFPGLNARDAFAGFWAAEGISIEDGEGGERRWYALETPLASWRVRNAVWLTEDLLLFQLGAYQICLMDPGDRRIALLERGWGPLVVREADLISPPARDF